MRIFSSLLLVAAFILGIVSAFAVAYYTFDAKPTEIVDRGPTVKILVAKKEIPVGMEIRAEDIRFTDVPVAEIPEEAITNFMQVYRRRPAYPIPVGCPICEDLLMPKTLTDAAENRFLPAGTQIVTLEISSVRQGNVLSESNLPIAHILQPGRKIDIRVVPEKGPQGELIDKKLAVINSFAEKKPEEEVGEIVLEDIEVHQVIGQTAAKNNSGRLLQGFSMILDDAASTRLAEAAKTGRLRVTLRREDQPASETESIEIQAAQAEEPARMETAEVPMPVARQIVQPIAARPTFRDAETTAPVDGRREELRWSTVAEPPSQAMRTPVPETVRNDYASTSRVTFVSPQKPTRQPMEAVRILDSSETQRQTITAPKTAPLRPRTEPRLFTVGSTIQAGEFDVETNGYSPFSRNTVVNSDTSENTVEEIAEPTTPKMLRSERPFPYRNR